MGPLLKTHQADLCCHTAMCVCLSVCLDVCGPLSPSPLLDPNAQFSYPLPGQLVNMSAPMIQYGSPKSSVLHLVVFIGTDDHMK